MAQAATAVSPSYTSCGCLPAGIQHSQHSTLASTSRCKLSDVVSDAKQEGNTARRLLCPVGRSSSIRTEDTTPQLFRCSYADCGRTFTRAAKLDEHERIHTGEKPFKCQHHGCDKAFRRLDHLRRHAKSHSAHNESTARAVKGENDGKQCSELSNAPLTELRPYICDVGIGDASGSILQRCGKRFLSQQHLTRHLREVHEIDNGAHHAQPSASVTRKRASHADNYVCSIGDCGARFHKRKLLRAHISLVHSDRGRALEGLDKEEAERIARLPFPCEHPGCQKRFATNSKRNAHAAQHADPARYKCVLPHDEKLHGNGDEKDWHFATWTEMQQHLRTHHRPQCPYKGCGKTFSEARNLRTHLLRVHHDCLPAGQDFLSNKSGNDDDSDIDAAEKASRRHICAWPFERSDAGSAVCGQSFSTRHARDVHVRNVHQGLRLFPCCFAEHGCERRFSSKRAAQRHSHKCFFHAKKDEDQGAALSTLHTDNQLIDSDDFFRREGGAVPEVAADRTRSKKRRRCTMDEEEEEERIGFLRPPQSLQGMLTGHALTESELQGKKRRQRGRVMACPWQRISFMRDNNDDDRCKGGMLSEHASQSSKEAVMGLAASSDDNVEEQNAASCPFRFSRLYDVQRHLRSAHGLELSQSDIRALLSHKERQSLGQPRSGTKAAQEEATTLDTA